MGIYEERSPRFSRGCVLKIKKKKRKFSPAVGKSGKSHGRVSHRGTTWCDLVASEEGELQRDLPEARILVGLIGAGEA